MPVTKNEDVMKMVRKTLEDDPDTPNQELYEKAKSIDSSVGDLTLRQFHARYPLQVKREMAGKKGGRKKKRKSAGKASAGGASIDRESVRETLLQFAKDISAAQGKADMIDLLTSIDDYVDEIVDGAGGS